MIFVCLGTQTYQFDRLTKKLDNIIGEGLIKEEVIAQIGYGEYVPQNYYYERYMSKEKFSEYQDKADLIIAHGGTGALISASKKCKNIIAVPRLSKYGEHIDDHQLQIVKILSEKGYIRVVYDIDNLNSVIEDAMTNPINKPFDMPSNVVSIIDNYISNLG